MGGRQRRSGASTWMARRAKLRGARIDRGPGDVSRVCAPLGAPVAVDAPGRVRPARGRAPRDNLRPRPGRISRAGWPSSHGACRSWRGRSRGRAARRAAVAEPPTLSARGHETVLRRCGERLAYAAEVDTGGRPSFGGVPAYASDAARVRLDALVIGSASSRSRGKPGVLSNATGASPADLLQTLDPASRAAAHDGFASDVPAM